VLCDPALRRRLEQGARQRVLDHFSLSEVVEHNLVVYEQIASRSG
jgi:hypothetical protein